MLVPFYFRFDAVGREAPPAITHPEFYYGFLVVSLAWQIGFLLIAADPIRFRPMMAIAMVEKFGYVGSSPFYTNRDDLRGATSRSAQLPILYLEHCG